MLAIIFTVHIMHEDIDLINLSELELNYINNINLSNCILWFYILSVSSNFTVHIFLE